MLEFAKFPRASSNVLGLMRCILFPKSEERPGLKARQVFCLYQHLGFLVSMSPWAPKVVPANLLLTLWRHLQLVYFMVEEVRSPSEMCPSQGIWVEQRLCWGFVGKGW